MNKREVFVDKPNSQLSNQTVYDRTLNWKIKAKKQRVKQIRILDRVEGIHKFEKIILSNHLLVFKTFDDYLDGIYPKKRKIIVYTQLAICWLFIIKFQLNSLIRNDYLDILTGNILPLFIERHKIVTQLIVFIATLLTIIGKFVY